MKFQEDDINMTYFFSKLLLNLFYTKGKGGLVMMKLALIEPYIQRPNQLQKENKNVKAQLKLIGEQKRANKQKVKQLQEELRITTMYAKQNKKQGNKEIAEKHLAVAFQLLDAITGLKRRIMVQEQLIEDILNS